MVQLARAESRAGDNDQSAAELAHILLRQFKKAFAEGRPRHVVEEQHIRRKKIAALRRQRWQEQRIRLTNARVGRGQKRAESIKSDELIAVEYFFDESPFPCR